MYVYLTINSFSTIALFLNTYYKKKFPPIVIENLESLNKEEHDDLPF